MANEFANARLDANSLVRWLDRVAAGPMLLAATIVGLVATIARVA